MAAEIHTGGGIFQGMTKLMWTNLEALLCTNHFFSIFRMRCQTVCTRHGLQEKAIRK